MSEQNERLQNIHDLCEENVRLKDNNQKYLRQIGDLQQRNTELVEENRKLREQLEIRQEEIWT